MAIHIEWQTMPPRNNNEEGKHLLYPRLNDNGTINEHELCKKVAVRSALTEGALTNALSDIIEIIGKELREGKTIEISALGSFRLSIGTNAEITSTTQRRKDKIVVRGVNFLPSDILMETIGKPDFKWTDKGGRQAVSTEDIIPALIDYFNTNDSITRIEFEKLFKLKHSTALTRIKELMEQGVIKAIGHNRDTRYVKQI